MSINFNIGKNIAKSYQIKVKQWTGANLEIRNTKLKQDILDTDSFVIFSNIQDF